MSASSVEQSLDQQIVSEYDQNMFQFLDIQPIAPGCSMDIQVFEYSHSLKQSSGSLQTRAISVKSQIKSDKVW